ncbi:hypothetical protein PR048_013710 [Dryococelus australis]|uniref:Uncharacterized protein n=1 Tax=Dryococelus australis TaxID=614101 RepID=A0ABQ9HT89_9NEOP|nr:hypothetical protein PR048_013710 [Dryococelus australis]
MFYGITFWGNSTDSKKVFHMQKRAVRIINGKRKSDSCRHIFKSSEILTLARKYMFSVFTFMSKNSYLFKKKETFHKDDTRIKKNLYRWLHEWHSEPLGSSIVVGITTEKDTACHSVSPDFCVACCNPHCFLVGSGDSHLSAFGEACPICSNHLPGLYLSDRAGLGDDVIEVVKGLSVNVVLRVDLLGEHEAIINYAENCVEIDACSVGVDYLRRYLCWRRMQEAGEDVKPLVASWGTLASEVPQWRRLASGRRLGSARLSRSILQAHASGMQRASWAVADSLGPASRALLTSALWVAVQLGSFPSLDLVRL